MGVRGRSAGLLAIAAFLAGGVAGVVVGRLGPAPARPSAPITSTRVDVSDPPPAPPSSPAPPRALPVLPGDAASDDADSALVGSVASGWATLVVTLADPAGPTDGAVYVLPAGAPGVDDVFTVPHGSVGTPLRVPAPATYDVGIRFRSDGDAILSTDVVVEPGRTHRVEIPRSVRVRRPIHMRVAPAGVGLVPPGWMLRIRWSPSGPTASEYPGLGEPREARLPVTSRFSPRVTAAAETEPLPEGGTWTAMAWVEVADIDDPPDERLEVPLRAVVVPPTARAGDRVEVRVEPVTLIGLHADAPEGGWPEGVGPVRITWEGDGPPASVEHATPWPLEQGESLEVSPGRGRITWSGPGIRSGRSEVFDATLPGEGIARMELRIELDPAQAPRPSRLFLRVRAGEQPIDVEEPATVYMLRSGGEGQPAEWTDVDRSWASDLRIDLAPSSTEDLHRLVVLHRNRSSAVLDVKGGADVPVDMLPGGWLVLIPADDAARVFTTELERIDGGPMFTSSSDPWNPRRRGVASTVPVTAGSVLGPFPEGPLRLRVLRGGLPVAELRPTIRAGAYVPLRLPR